MKPNDSTNPLKVRRNQPPILLTAFESLSVQIRALELMRDGIVRQDIVNAIPKLRAECGFGTAPDETKEAWNRLEQKLSPFEILELLTELKKRKATVSEFVSIQQSRAMLGIKEIVSLLSPKGSRKIGLFAAQPSTPSTLLEKPDGPSLSPEE